jgi:hypothetical protein
MGYFMLGLGIVVLGFGFLQFSAMFNLYKAQKDDDRAPWAYLILKALAYLSFVLGGLVIFYSINR